MCKGMSLLHTCNTARQIKSFGKISQTVHKRLLQILRDAQDEFYLQDYNTENGVC